MSPHMPGGGLSRARVVSPSTGLAGRGWLRTLAGVCASLLLAFCYGTPPAQAQQAERPFKVPDAWRFEWPTTDFSAHNVDLRDILNGGPPKDGIPPIDAPQFERSAQAADWLTPASPVLVLAKGNIARAYPLAILIWHEIVNDQLGDVPVAVTYCPLCNAGLVFDRRVAGRVLDFGTTGKLRFSDLVMWDRQTESWWQQMTGTAIVGELTGTTLQALNAPMVSFSTFRSAYPKGQVLSRETGYLRSYGENPYVGYDSSAHPFLFDQAADPRLKPLERVVTLQLGAAAKAYPHSALAEHGVVADEVAGQAVVVFYEPTTVSALDAPNIADSRAVGAGTVFSAELGGRVLVFRAVPQGFQDAQTGTLWNPLGQALEGPLAGQQLRPVAHGNHFAFAWFAFRPNSAVYGQ